MKPSEMKAILIENNHWGLRGHIGYFGYCGIYIAVKTIDRIEKFFTPKVIEVEVKEID